MSAAGQIPAAPVPATAAPDFVVIDVETACSRASSICQVGIVGFRNGVEVFEYETLLDPLDDFSPFNVRVHGITSDHVLGKPTYAHVHEVVDRHLAGRITVAHSLFDKNALGLSTVGHAVDLLRDRKANSRAGALRDMEQEAAHDAAAVRAFLLAVDDAGYARAKVRCVPSEEGGRMSDAIHDLCLVLLLVAAWLGVPIWSAAHDLRELRRLASWGRQ